MEENYRGEEKIEVVVNWKAEEKIEVAVNWKAS